MSNKMLNTETWLLSIQVGFD